MAQLGPDPEPLGTDRYERLVKDLDSQFADVDMMVGVRVVRWIEDSDLSLHEARALMALNQGRPPMTVPDIADRAGLDLDTAYKTVHDLHGRGLTDEQNRNHELSERGRDLMQSFADVRREGVRDYLHALDTDERHRIGRALETS
jgi:DNA-binding MarR family transcriptional regulator